MPAHFTKVALFAAVVTASLSASVTAKAEKVAVHNMSRYCVGEASGKFGVKPQDIKADKPYKGGLGNYNVNGKTTGDRKIEFRCHFDESDEFRWVRSMEELHQQHEKAGKGEPPSALVRACNAVDDDYGEVLEATPLKPGAWEIILKYSKGNYVCNVEAGGKVTYFEKLK